MKAFGSGNLTVTGGTLRTTGGPLAVDIGAGNILFSGGTWVTMIGGISPGVTHDQIRTTGTANITGATVALVQLGNYHLHPGDKVVLVLATGGVSGGTANGTPLPADKVMGLAAFSNNPLLLIPIVNLYPTSVVLEAVQGSFMALAHTLAFTPRQAAIAGALDSVLASNGGTALAAKELDYLDSLPPAALGANLEMLSPAAMTSLFNLSAALANVQTANIQGHLADIRAAAGDVVPIHSVNVSAGSGKETKAPVVSCFEVRC